MAGALPEVVVLLSSYNGEKYIQQQIDSILAQQGVSVRLFVRDDGSKDGTPALLAQLAREHANIQFTLEENVGLVRSFFRLLERADARCEFFAFADQDDVWLPEKLSNAVAMLRANDLAQPLMYCARVEYVDAVLNHLAYSPRYDQHRIGFGNALVQNIATGCTIVLNRAARDRIISNLPEKCLVHDWWMYMVVSAFGKVVYDDRPSMKYRQHGGNVIGASASFVKNLKNRVRRFARYSEATRTSTQLREFGRLFGGELDPQKRRLVERMLRRNTSILGRCLLVFSNQYWRQSLLDQILLRLVILAGRF